MAVAEDPGLRDELEAALRHLTSFERPSASDGERRAAEEIAARLRAEGCSARVEEERAHGGYWWPIGLANAATALAALTGRRGLAAATGAFAAAAVADDVSGGRLWFRRAVLPHRTTYNVHAETGDPGARRTLVLIAHHDAAHGGLVFDPRPIRALYERKPEIFEEADRHAPIMASVVAGPVLVALGALLGRRGLRRLGTGLALGTVAAMADIARSPIAPGANDNLSSVAVLLAVARRLREEPVAGVRVVLLSTGAEESFMEGMQGWGRRHFPALPKDATELLCLECVGSPLPVVVEGEGMLRMRLYPEGAREELAAAAADAGVDIERGLKTVLATDGLIPLRAGYETALLATVEPGIKLPSNYHGPHDTVDNLHWGTLMDCCRIAERWVRRRARGTDPGSGSAG